MLTTTFLRGFRQTSNKTHIYRYFSKPQRPMDPTAAESFGTKVSKEDLQNLLNPVGFLNEHDLENYEGVEDAKQNSYEYAEPKVEDKVESEEPKIVHQEQPDYKTMPKEYGFRVKGPEPTRYGDWERNGRCFDF